MNVKAISPAIESISIHSTDNTIKKQSASKMFLWGDQ